MNLADYKKLSIDGIELKDLTINGVLAWKAKTFTNLIPLSTEADGKTIYNGGLGYKDRYRVRSGGAEAEDRYTTITGYIPYKKGDKLYIYPPFFGENTANTVNFYDVSFACLGQITDSGVCYGFCTSAFKTKVVNGVSVLDISSVTVSGIGNVAYVRIGNSIATQISSGSQMIITKNEEMEL